MTKKAAVCVFVVSLGLSILGSPAVVAAQYLGETTWTVSITQDEYGPKSNTSIITGAITRAGGAYYTMQGYANPPEDAPFILAGGGVLIGQTLYLTLTASQPHTNNPDNWRDTSVLQFQLDKISLGLSILGSPAVVAAQYLGETTWTITITQDENGLVEPRRITP